MSQENEPESLWDPADDQPAEPAPPKRPQWVEALIVVFGMIALVAPLGLWIAWTQAILLGVLGAGLVSILACY